MYVYLLISRVREKKDLTKLRFTFTILILVKQKMKNEDEKRERFDYKILCTRIQ